MAQQPGRPGADEAPVSSTPETAAPDAAEAAMAARVAGQEAALKRAHAQLARLLAVSAALAGATTPAEVAAAALEQAVAALGASSGLLAILDQASGELELIASLGYPPAVIEPWRRFPVTAPVPMADSARTGQPLLIGSLDEAEARYPQLHAIRAQVPEVAWATLPLVRGALVTGVITVSFTTPQVFPADVQGLLVALAQQCAQALERALLLEAAQRARRAAEEAVQQRDNLIAVLSHDLKNPLTTIMGRASMLQRQAAAAHAPEPQALQRGLSAISTAAHRMREQIDELLDSVRLQAGQPLALQREPTDLAALIAELTAQLALSDQHALVLEGVETALVCCCDRRQIKRVLANILANAVKYSPDGGEIRVSLAGRHAAAGGWAELSVADQGVGIPADELERIFEPFFRASNGLRLAQGTGLGLASARQVAELHGGTITVASREGVGSTFRLRLPLAAATSQAAGESEAAAPSR